MSNTSHIYPHCLNEDELRMLAFHPGRHPNEAALKEHVTSCELCSDALEGIQLLNEEAFSESMEHLHSKIEEQVSKNIDEVPREVPLRRWMAAAASLVLIMSMAYFMNLYFNKDKKQLSDSREPSEYQRPELSNADTESDGFVSTKKQEQTINEVDEEAENFLKDQSVVQAPVKEKRLNVEPPPTNFEMYTPQDADFANAPGNIQGGASVPDANKSVQKEDIVNNKSMAPVTADKIQNIPQKNITVTEESISKKKEKYNRKESNAPVVNDEKMQMESVTSTGIFTDSLYVMSSAELLNQAKARYNASQYNEAVKLCNLIVSRNDAQREEALLIKAKSLIKLNKTSEAKKILKSLTDNNSVFKTEAEEILKTL